jgi:hypothetical protein
MIIITVCGQIYEIPRQEALNLSRELNKYFAIEAKAHGYDIRTLNASHK